MADTIAAILDQLDDLRKAYVKLFRAIPDPITAEARAQKAFEITITLLQQKDIEDRLDEFLQSARELLNTEQRTVNAQLSTRSRDIMRREAELTRSLRTKRADLLTMHVTYQRVQDNHQSFARSTKELIGNLRLLHQELLAEARESRGLARYEKKKRKRELLRGASSFVFGAGVIVGDLYAPPLFVFSYALGGGAVHSALRDWVGDKNDN